MSTSMSRNNGVSAIQEEQVTDRIKRISMLSRDSLLRLRHFARDSRGMILEVGPYVGGSTCAIGDAVRGQGRRFITVECGGEPDKDYHGNAHLPSHDIPGDLRRNLASWDLTDAVEVKDCWALEAYSRLETEIGDDRIGFLFIDADGEVGLHLNRLMPFLADDCFIALDDFGEGAGSKSQPVQTYVAQAVQAGALEQTAIDVTGSTWFGRLRARERLPLLPFIHNGGHCWISARTLESGSDDVDRTTSRVRIFEDDEEIGPGHVVHDNIRTHGLGRFSYWRGALYFSTSDNSDPTQNGRTYTARFDNRTVALNVPTERRVPSTRNDYARRRVVDSPLWEDYVDKITRIAVHPEPVNWRQRSPEEISDAADNGLRVGRNMAEVLEKFRVPCDGTLLEIGPGLEFGATMIVGARAKRLIVSDRYLASWSDSFHPAVYRTIRERLGSPNAKLDQVVSQESLDGVVETFEESAFDLNSLADASVDLVFSNAVLEHVQPLDGAAREFFRVTCPGGYGVHQIDFRYHRSFAHPLEHLLFTRHEFEDLSISTHNEVGCQTRVKEVEALFAEAGFVIKNVNIDMTASADYLRDFMPRLRASDVSPYRDWAEEDVAKISGRIIVQRPPA